MAFATLEFRDKVAEITIDRPTGNLINGAVLTDLLTILDELQRGAPPAVLLKAAGPDFCVGSEYPDAATKPLPAIKTLVQGFDQVIVALEKIRVPTIAIVQGDCLAGGFQLALSCDFIIAARTAQFAFPEPAFGLPPTHAGLAQLADRIGRNRAIELALLGSVLDAEEMERLNVVNRVVDDERLEQEARALGQRIAAGSLKGHICAKALLGFWSSGGIAGARSAVHWLARAYYAD